MPKAVILGRTFEISWLEAAFMIASRAGYTDLDVEPWDGKVTITAKKADGRTDVFSAPTADLACEKLIDNVG